MLNISNINAKLFIKSLIRCAVKSSNTRPSHVNQSMAEKQEALQAAEAKRERRRKRNLGL